MPPSRLTALDASFLAAETPTAHMHVGWAAIFDPPERAPRPTFEQLRDHIDARLDRAPRYRQKLAFVPLGVHDPEWVDDDDFRIDRHVLPAPAGDIDAIIDAAMSSPLERSRPLWECWIAPRLDDGRIGIVGKVHHCMVDGLAAVELAALLLDGEPAAPPSSPSRWQPEPAPGAIARLAHGTLARARQEAHALAAPVKLLAAPSQIAGAADSAREAALSIAGSLTSPAQPTPALNPDLSPLRHLGRLSRPLDDLTRVKTHFGTTVNDVVLAIAAGGVRRLLEERGEPAVGVKAMVPVARRGSGEAAGLGNAISFLFIDLPSDEPEAAERLRTVHATTQERKQSGEMRGGGVVLDVLGYAPRVVQRALTRIVASPRTFNLVVSNIPGPQVPMWMHGCRLREVYPIVPLAERHALAIGVTTLEDELFFGIYADRKMLPDTRALTSAIDESLDELVAACEERVPVLA